MATRGEQKIVTNEVYHVFTRSIAGFRIFNGADEFLRIKDTICYYRERNPEMKYSRHKQIRDEQRLPGESVSPGARMVEIIAYCFMPTHIHLVLKQIEDNAISVFMNRVLNSYTRYFNLRHKRKGPLWEGRFKKVLVETDEQLLHLTRYIHLNPVTAHLSESPEHWHASSYQEYLNDGRESERITFVKDILDINPRAYREFVEERKDFQRELQKIKDILWD